MPYDAELGKQLKFTADDLATNQRGKLSKKQQRKHKLDIYVGTGVAIIFSLVFLLLGIILLFEIVIVGVVVIFTSLGLAGVAVRYSRVKRTVKQVHSFTGQVIGIDSEPRIGRTVKTTERNFYIAYRSFIMPHLYKRTFIFYYIEPNDLLSVEEVTSEATLKEIASSIS